MKKVIVLLFALTIVVGAAFAQATVNGYERAIVTVSDSDVAIANRLRLNLSFKDADENFGFAARLQSDSFADAAFKYAYGWAQFFDGKVKVSAGSLLMYDYVARWTGISDTQLGNIYTDFLWGDCTKGGVVEVFPIDGVSIAAGVLPDDDTLYMGRALFAAKYATDELSVIGVGLINEVTEESAASFTIDYSGLDMLGVAAGYMYGGGPGYQEFSDYQGDSTAFAIVDFTMGDFSAQVAPTYTFYRAKLYIEGYVNYAMGDFSVSAFGAYDQYEKVLGSAYFFGGELSYAIGGGYIMTGFYYDEVARGSIPVGLKIVF